MGECDAEAQLDPNPVAVGQRLAVAHAECEGDPQNVPPNEEEGVELRHWEGVEEPLEDAVAVALREDRPVLVPLTEGDVDTPGLVELERATVGDALKKELGLGLGEKVGTSDSEADTEGHCDPEGVPDSDTDTLVEALTDWELVVVLDKSVDCVAAGEFVPQRDAEELGVPLRQSVTDGETEGQPVPLWDTEGHAVEEKVRATVRDALGKADADAGVEGLPE